MKAELKLIYNRMMADFLDLKPKEPGMYTLRSDGSKNCRMVFPPECEFWAQDKLIFDDDIHYHLEFDTNWQWLMAVVHKCLKCSPVKPLCNYTSQEKKANRLFELGISAPMEVVYLYCIQFIEWYNKQKKV